ncbi:MAG: glycosyltransferase family 4 protein [Actinobacteria bacterium]|nr:glycosyltransferase family 4 protein [Actinomycetota bacterium]
MRLKVAWFSPLPPQKSGIAEYSQDLLPYLHEHMDIDLFVEDPGIHQDTPLASEFNIFNYLDYRDMNRPIKYDINIYHMGNNINHRFVYLSLVETPGLVVLHEPMLHHFMLEMLSDSWTMRDYMRELDYNYSVDREDIETIVGSDGSEMSRFNYPMIQRVIDSSIGIIVHSLFARNEVLKHHTPCPVRIINMPFVPIEDGPEISREAAREKVNIHKNDFIVGTFGFVTPAKGIDAILEATGLLINDIPNLKLLMVGGHVPEYPVEDIVAKKGLEEHVLMPGYVDFQDLELYMHSCDLSISLRYPSAGETPASVVRLLGSGCPVVLSDTKAFREFPDGICTKIDPESSPENIRNIIIDLHDNLELLKEKGEAAKKYTSGHNNPEKAASDYAEFANYVISGYFSGRNCGNETYKEFKSILREALLEEITEKLAAMEVGAKHVSLLEDLSHALDSTIGRIESSQ